MSALAGPSYLVTPEGTFQIRDSDEAADVVCVLTEQYADPVAEPLVALSRQQVTTRLGQRIPGDFPVEDVVAGDRQQGGTRLWWESTVQRYLGGGAAGEVDANGSPEGEASALKGEDPQEPAVAGAWPVKSQQWTDVNLSGVDQRVLLATSKGIVTPSGVVKSAALASPERLGAIVCNRRWAASSGGPAPQIWVTAEALEAIGFQIDDQIEGELPAVVADFFGCEVKYHLSGWFGCEFDSAVYGGESRAADIILMPYLMLDPSTARPMDRGIAGVEGTETELPDDEDAAVHLLGDRIAWLHSMEGTLPASRWPMVGVQLAVAKMRTAKPRPKNTSGPAPELKPCPLPKEISPTGRLINQWWGPHGVAARDGAEPGQEERPAAKVKNAPHRARGNTIDVEVDQQAAYLPSAEGLYLGYGTPDWVEPDPKVFNQPTPPFGIYQITTPAGSDLDGLHRKLPLPHPEMRWDEATTWWATTADVRHLTADPETGGAGISWAELQIDSAWVWPEQHQWLKGFGKELRSRRIEATAAGRADYESMIKAIYTSTLGRMAAVGDSAWKYPHLNLTQPAWYASVEAVTRARAMKYATRIARDFDLYPIGWWADAWFYRVPDDFDLSQLEDPLRDGVRTNGSYRIKNVNPPRS